MSAQKSTGEALNPLFKKILFDYYVKILKCPAHINIIHT